jgi:chromosome segregation ATPase
MDYEERFDRIDAKIGELATSVSELRGSVSELRGSVSELTGSVSELTGSVSDLKDSLAHLTRYVLDFREETARRLDVIDNRLDILNAQVANIEARYPIFTKAILDFGSFQTRVTNDQIRDRNAIAELRSYISRLDEKVSKIVNPAA